MALAFDWTSVPESGTRAPTLRRRLMLAFALFALVLAFAPLVFTSGLALTMMSLMGVMIIFALSYNVLLGQTGLLSFGHAVYYGLGGFCAAHAMNYVARNKFGVPLPAIPLVGAAAGLFFGAIFGAVSTRRAGTGWTSRPALPCGSSPASGARCS